MNATGFDAIGKPVPLERCSEALRTIREMAPDMGTEDAMSVIGRMSTKLEKDQPYEAMREGMDGGIDLTGTYRLMAVLLTDPATGEGGRHDQ